MPQTLRAEILQKVHEKHQGSAVKCRERACSSMWWLGLSADIKKLVTSCQVSCELKRMQQKEPLIFIPLPERPWKRIAMGLCEHSRQNYLVISDNYSIFIEILPLPTMTCAQVIHRQKIVFARFGIPDEVESDNVKNSELEQFSSSEFSKQLYFKHITLSPHHPQGNGHADMQKGPCKQQRKSSSNRTR